MVEVGVGVGVGDRTQVCLGWVTSHTACPMRVTCSPQFTMEINTEEAIWLRGTGEGDREGRREGRGVFCSEGVWWRLEEGV